jgi:predicted TPR repeat methyltransferase
MTAKEHYDRHLASFYSWMVGDFEAKQAIQHTFFVENGIEPLSNRVAFDLGCGHGLQSVPLAALGFKVHAVDFNQYLLNQLKGKSLELPIKCIENDIITFLRESEARPELIVCMGDTLTHLESLQHVEDMISLSSKKLEVGGKLILSFRMLDSELTNEKRFIPVKSDDERIHTCFLEYSIDVVKVYDILHEKKDGVWEQRVSWYPKLRISLSFISSALGNNNFTIRSQHVTSGMTYLIAERV